MTIPLLRADPHHWGQGLVHKIDLERDQTMCGKSPGGCPGTPFHGEEGQITCKSCMRAVQSRIRSAAIRQQMQANERQREAERQVEAQQREQDRALWNTYYQNYLNSPTWRTKRARVLQRANGLCEGCGDRAATQVHHLRYPQGCWPGTPEWCAQEKLFDLRAICRNCHEDVHLRRFQ